MEICQKEGTEKRGNSFSEIGNSHRPDLPNAAYALCRKPSSTLIMREPPRKCLLNPSSRIRQDRKPYATIESSHACRFRLGPLPNGSFPSKQPPKRSSKSIFRLLPTLPDDREAVLPVLPCIRDLAVRVLDIEAPL